MVNHYETAFILTPVLSEIQMKEAVDKFEKLLVDNGATIGNREEWGLKRLAYPIQAKRRDSTPCCSLTQNPVLLRRSKRLIAAMKKLYVS